MKCNKKDIINELNFSIEEIKELRKNGDSAHFQYAFLCGEVSAYYKLEVLSIDEHTYFSDIIRELLVKY